MLVPIELALNFNLPPSSNPLILAIAEATTANLFGRVPKYRNPTRFLLRDANHRFCHARFAALLAQETRPVGIGYHIVYFATLFRMVDNRLTFDRPEIPKSTASRCRKF